MIDPLVSLAFNIQSNKGVYALLLGSGISRSSGIPTGWDIILDLSTKLAAAMGEDTDGDPEKWYLAKFKKEPHYSELLDALCKTQAERQQLLRPYFEPTDDERDQGLKQPTKAHRAIAKLMVAGYIRVAITMNFDRLLEQAIQDEGTAPFVISSDDGILGAPPIVHQKCCVVKLHGDYLDTRIRNTPGELSKYQKKTNAFLDQMFDQFGLIVCGWSAQWDIALRAAITRCPTRRFSTYWCSRGKPTDEAQQIISSRSADLISISDANSFFVKLADMVQGIEQANTAHPRSMDALVALTKRYLSDHKFSINLSDLFHDEAETTLKSIEEFTKQSLGKVTYEKIFEQYRLLISRVQVMLIHGCAFGSQGTFSLWIDTIQRIGMKPIYGQQFKDGIRQYPTVLLLYSSGLAALAAGRLDLAGVLLTKPIYRDNMGSKAFLVSPVWTEIGEIFKGPNNSSGTAAKSEHIFAVLREPLRRYLPDDAVYERVFDEWEYLLAMVYLDLDQLYVKLGMPWAPPGRFSWRTLHDKSTVLHRSKEDFEKQQGNWPPLLAGLFGGNIERVKELQDRLLQILGRNGY